MSEELFIRHCSPTLAGIKPGSMFPYSYATPEELLEYIRSANHVLVPDGLRVLPLRYGDGHALIYVFRPTDIEKVLQDKIAVSLLKKCGYTNFGVQNCICHLIGRFQHEKEFPHEVGLFLGYPPEDVVGFMENKACGHKCVGCWKVYGDEQKARKTFAKYKKCTEEYCSQWEQGKSIERLTVAG